MFSGTAFPGIYPEIILACIARKYTYSGPKIYLHASQNTLTGRGVFVQTSGQSEHPNRPRGPPTARSTTVQTVPGIGTPTLIPTRLSGLFAGRGPPKYTHTPPKIHSHASQNTLTLIRANCTGKDPKINYTRMGRGGNMSMPKIYSRPQNTYVHPRLHLRTSLT